MTNHHQQHHSSVFVMFWANFSIFIHLSILLHIMVDPNIWPENKNVNVEKILLLLLWVIWIISHTSHIYINILEYIDDDVWKTQKHTTITVKQDYWPRYCRISNIFQTFLFLKFSNMMMMMMLIIIISNCVSLSHKSEQLFPSHILIDITTYATGFNKSTYSSFLLLFFRKHHWICFQYSRVINKIFFFHESYHMDFQFKM